MPPTNHTNPPNAPYTIQQLLYKSYVDNEGNVTQCPCGENSKQTEFMISCDRCEVWLHGKCLGIIEGGEPEVFFCENCEPDDEIHVLRRNNQIIKNAKKMKKLAKNAEKMNNGDKNVGKSAQVTPVAPTQKKKLTAKQLKEQAAAAVTETENLTKRKKNQLQNNQLQNNQNVEPFSQKSNSLSTHRLITPSDSDNPNYDRINHNFDPLRNDQKTRKNDQKDNFGDIETTPTPTVNPIISVANIGQNSKENYKNVNKNVFLNFFEKKNFDEIFNNSVKTLKANTFVPKSIHDVVNIDPHLYFTGLIKWAVVSMIKLAAKTSSKIGQKTKKNQIQTQKNRYIFLTISSELQHNVIPYQFYGSYPSLYPRNIFLGPYGVLFSKKFQKQIQIFAQFFLKKY
jgi:hypothetical protein